MARVEMDPRASAAIRGMLADRLEQIGQETAELARQIAPKDTGVGAASIVHQLDREKLLVEIGTPLLHMRFMEIGAPAAGVAPQAFLRPAMVRLRNRYRRILGR